MYQVKFGGLRPPLRRPFLPPEEASKTGKRVRKYTRASERERGSLLPSLRGGGRGVGGEEQEQRKKKRPPETGRARVHWGKPPKC